MDNLLYIIKFCYGLLSYRLYFYPFSFTIFQAMLGSCCIGLVVKFIISLSED